MLLSSSLVGEPGKQGVAQLQDLIDAHQLEQCYGGSAPNLKKGEFYPYKFLSDKPGTTCDHAWSFFFRHCPQSQGASAPAEPILDRIFNATSGVSFWHSSGVVMEQHLNVLAEQAELIERTVKLMRLGVRSQISDCCIPEPKDPLVRDVDQLIRILDQDGDDDVEEHNSEECEGSLSSPPQCLRTRYFGHPSGFENDGDAVSCGSSEVARVRGRRTPQFTKLRDPLGRKSFVRQEESTVLRRVLVCGLRAVSLNESSVGVLRDEVKMC